MRGGRYDRGARHESGGYEGEPEGDRMGEGLPSVLRSQKATGLKAEETIKRGGTWGARPLRNGRQLAPPFVNIHEGGVGYLEAGWDTYSD